MKNLIDKLIEVVGISDIMPKNSKYFKQFSIQEYFSIPSLKPDIEQILRITVNPQIIETKIINTAKAESHEGQKLEGKKLLVRGKLIQKVEYIADDEVQSVHSAESETIFANYIILDDDVDCNVPIVVIPYVEDIYIKQINNRTIFKNIMILINAVSHLFNPSNHIIEQCKEETIADRYKKIMECFCKCKEKKYFVQFAAYEIIKIPSVKPDIEHIVSAIVNPEIISLKVINTMKGLSCEGQYLSGKKIAVELKISQKILYTADAETQSVHGVENEFYRSVYVVVPEKIEGTDIETLLKYGHLQSKINVEDIFITNIDKRNIFKNVTMHLEFCYVPTYELCYSNYNNCKNSNLYIAYEDGLHNSQLTFEEDKKNINPQWSPDGKFISYLSNYNNKSVLCVMNLKSLAKHQLTMCGEFNSIGDYFWLPDGKKIIFAAKKNNCMEIYETDVKSIKCEKLTDGNGIVDSFDPKYFKCGNDLVFLRKESNISNIWTSNINGLNIRKVTNCGFIKDYDCKNYSKEIIAVSDKGGCGDKIIYIDMECFKTKLLVDCDCVYEKRCIKVSPDDKYAAFIGKKFRNDSLSDIDDIYVYEFNSKVLINITNNMYKLNISDFVWKIDSSKIYYSSNELGYYNVYLISMNNFCKNQLTNSCASNMQLSYRTRVE